MHAQSLLDRTRLSLSLFNLLGGTMARRGTALLRKFM